MKMTQYVQHGDELVSSMLSIHFYCHFRGGLCQQNVGVLSCRHVHIWFVTTGSGGSIHIKAMGRNPLRGNVDSGSAHRAQ